MKKNNFLITGANSFLGSYLLTNLDKKFSDTNFYIVTRNEFKFSSDTSQKNNFFYFNCDLVNRNQVSEIINKILKQSNNKIDYLIFLAISKTNEYFEDINEKKIERDININVLSTLNFVKKILPSMILRNSGHIINISSGTAICGLENASIYSMSKSAIQTFTESLNDELNLKEIYVKNFFTGVLTKNNIKLISKNISKNIESKKLNIFIQKYPYFAFLIKLFPRFKFFLKYFKKFFFKN